MQACFLIHGSIDERRNRIINTFDKRDSVTEIERALITQCMKIEFQETF